MADSAGDVSGASDTRSYERVGENNARFRAANERVHDAAVVADFSAPIPFVCECADEHCVELVLLPLLEYERVRADPVWFLSAEGHERNDAPAATVAERHDGWSIVEKVGSAAEIARETEPRGGGES